MDWEQPYWRAGTKFIAGMDEVGRGALAGPIVAAAVVFASDHLPLSGINDSKQVTARVREKLAAQIQQTALCHGIGVGSVEMINQFGIVAAQRYAMEAALNQLTKCNLIAIDGLPFKQKLLPKWPAEYEFIVKGDAKVYSIAAASIVAKVYRDALMVTLAAQYPAYDWKNNVGYGTTRHRLGIKTAGICEQHRKLFCRKLI